MEKLKIIEMIESESGNHFYPIYDWDDSEREWTLIGPFTIEFAKKRQCFLHPVKLLQMSLDDLRLSHIAVRTDAYPLLWMWAWFVEKARAIARQDFWLMMRLAYAVGLLRPSLDRHPGVEDFIFWPTLDRYLDWRCLIFGALHTVSYLAQDIDSELSVIESKLKDRLAVRKGGVYFGFNLPINNGRVDWRTMRKILIEAKTGIDKVLRE